MILALDPGKTFGWALFDEAARRLVDCGVDDHKSPKREVSTIYCPRNGELSVLIEKPHKHGKVPLEDIIALAIRAGELGGQFSPSPVRYIEPVEWKGNLPKEISHARIWAKLTPAEQNLVAVAAKGMAPSKRHNMLDAIGIGLFGVGRRA